MLRGTGALLQEAQWRVEVDGHRHLGEVLAYRVLDDGPDAYLHFGVLEERQRVPNLRKIPLLLLLNGLSLGLFESGHKILVCTVENFFKLVNEIRIVHSFLGFSLLVSLVSLVFVLLVGFHFEVLEEVLVCDPQSLIVFGRGWEVLWLEKGFLHDKVDGVSLYLPHCHAFQHGIHALGNFGDRIHGLPLMLIKRLRRGLHASEPLYVPLFKFALKSLHVI